MFQLYYEFGKRKEKKYIKCFKFAVSYHSTLLCNRCTVGEYGKIMNDKKKMYARACMRLCVIMCINVMTIIYTEFKGLVQRYIYNFLCFFADLPIDIFTLAMNVCGVFYSIFGQEENINIHNPVILRNAIKTMFLALVKLLCWKSFKCILILYSRSVLKG